MEMVLEMEMTITPQRTVAGCFGDTRARVRLRAASSGAAAAWVRALEEAIEAVQAAEEEEDGDGGDGGAPGIMGAAAAAVAGTSPGGVGGGGGGSSRIARLRAMIVVLGEWGGCLVAVP